MEEKSIKVLGRWNSLLEGSDEEGRDYLGLRAEDGVYWAEWCMPEIEYPSAVGLNKAKLNLMVELVIDACSDPIYQHDMTDSEARSIVVDFIWRENNKRCRKCLREIEES